MIKGFLQAEDSQAYSIYAAYGALVYATPYIGGVLADQFQANDGPSSSAAF